MVHEVNDATFQKEVIESNQICIVDFWAPWCGPCKMIAPVFTQLSEKFTAIKFVKMNVDENQVVPSKFSIQSIPTFIVFKNGAEINRKIGGMSKDQFIAWIEQISK